MTNQKRSMHDPTSAESREHRQWLETLQTWRIEHKQALAKLTRIQAALMAHDAEIEAQLAKIRRHTRFIDFESENSSAQMNGNAAHVDSNPFGTKEQHQQEHRALRKEIEQAANTHRRTHQVLDETIDKMHSIRAENFVTAPKDSKRPGNGDEVHEAGVESFPASDPPSFNPSST